MRFRSHNYAFAVPFFIEMYKLTGEVIYAERALSVMCRYYEKFSGFGIGFMMSVEELPTTDGMPDIEKNRERIDYVRRVTETTVQRIAHSDGQYAADEVSYEQGHPSTCAVYLTRHFLEAGDISLLQPMKAELERTQLFDGRQPDYHQHGQPIRHWDGFWFGSLELWGDTCPHWLGWTSAVAYENYARISGDMRYHQYAEEIFYANLSLIRPDGAAACCYIYNEKSNGRPADMILYAPIRILSTTII